MARDNHFVLDSYAVIGFLENEAFAERIENLLVKAKNNEATLFLHAIHLGEVYYIALREQGRDLADLIYARVKTLPLKIISIIDDFLLMEACALKAAYPISCADSFAAGLSIIHKCPLLTGDPEFKPLEKDGLIRVEWLS